jgi:two-component system cell cycle sensor histidine kinase/response regulator CckA
MLRIDWINTTTLEFKTVDLNRIIPNFYSLLRRTVREDIAIDIILEPSIPPINADPGQIEQVIMNLAVNAQDAMPKGGQLTIETGPVDLDADYAARHEAVHPGHYIMLAVNDNGHGIDP